MTKNYLGIDLGGTTIKFAIVTEEGEIVGHDRIPTDGEEGHEAVITRMIATAKHLVESHPDQPVESIGVAIPGVIDMVNGISIFLPNLPGDWPNVPVTAPIANALGKSAWLINDVRAFTLAELTLGSAQGITTGVFYAVGTGIGGGIVAHGKLNLGVGGAGGELGHMIVNANGPECGCGNRGCAEAYAAGPALISEANRRIVMGETTSLRDKIGDDLNRMVPELVEEAAGEGDRVAQEVLDYAGFHFGLGIAGAISAAVSSNRTDTSGSKSRSRLARIAMSPRSTGSSFGRPDSATRREWLGRRSGRGRSLPAGSRRHARLFCQVDLVAQGRSCNYSSERKDHANGAETGRSQHFCDAIHAR